MLRICKLGEEVLRQVAKPVSEITQEHKKLAEEMFETMIEANGVGLAAPQIGLSIRMFVIIADDDVRRVFINPQIISTSEEMVPYEEGCLSIPEVYESILRPKKITVQAFDENGKPFTLEADGFLARVIQHEYDHLDGKLFIDHLSEEERNKMLKAYEKKQKRGNKKK